MKWSLKFEDYIKLSEDFRIYDANYFDPYAMMSKLINFKVKYIDPDKLFDFINKNSNEIFGKEKASNFWDDVFDKENKNINIKIIDLLRKEGKIKNKIMETLEKEMEGVPGPLKLYFQNTSTWNENTPSAFLAKGPQSFHNWIRANIDQLHILPIFMNNFKIWNIEKGYWGENENSFYWVISKEKIYKIELKYSSSFGHEIYKAFETQKQIKLPGQEKETLAQTITLFNASPELQLKIVEENPNFVNNIEHPTVEAQEKAIKLGGKEMIGKIYWPLPEIKEKYKYFFKMQKSGILGER